LISLRKHAYQGVRTQNATAVTLDPALNLEESYGEGATYMRVLAGFMVFAAIVAAADVSGNWKATAEGPNGTMERTFSLQVAGDKLTGDTTSSFFGKSTIENGKIEGDNLSFQITVKFQDNSMRLNYKGKVVKSDEIHFTVDSPDMDQTFEWKATKVK
jgi:hypothetical protein